jgi:hypothetical protein
MGKKVIEVCLGVGMGQIFPEITRILIEDDVEEFEETQSENVEVIKPKKRTKKVKPVDTEIGKEFFNSSDIIVEIENPKRRGRKKKSE